jgi:hypothetical protein
VTAIGGLQRRTCRGGSRQTRTSATNKAPLSINFIPTRPSQTRRAVLVIFPGGAGRAVGLATWIAASRISTTVCHEYKLPLLTGFMLLY